MIQETMVRGREEPRAHLRYVPWRSGEGGKQGPPFPAQAHTGVVTACVSEGRKPKLLDQVRDAIRMRHYSLRTEEAYVRWVKRFILFHGKRHPLAMGGQEVSQFLSSLAVQGKVSASTQHQALNAIIFLYREVLGRDFGWLQEVVRAKKPKRLPVVLSKEEIQALLRELRGVKWLMATLLYGAGLRLLECLRLRVKDIDFARNQIVVRAGKGAKDRLTMLPAVVKTSLVKRLQEVQRQHREDLMRGFGRVYLPDALERKYPNANKEWGWQWVFPASQISTDPRSGERRRHHLHESVLQRDQGSNTAGRHRQACQLPHPPSFLCHSLN
jgi:integron integrase